ncbi:MAG: MBL fold metallo-hydrolase, partial [Deltaproteobacteria bacterium]|nr:MBL fold metallo-hydrolase [Deltaproteobacteria bacterium]
PPGPVDWLVCESTYGERLHDAAALAEDELADVIRETVERGGRVVVPAFAVGRVQELVWHLHRLYDSHRIPRVPVFVDSPMAVRATEVFREHVECYDRQTVSEFLENGDNPFSYRALRFVIDREESKRLNDYRHPCIVISSSGMCEAGRVLHHLVHVVDDPRCTILVVGFMAGNTLGRALADRRPEVRIFGETFRLRARVKILNSFSAHADRREICDWIGGLDRARLRGVFLVHGEPDAQDALASQLLGMGIPRAEALLPGRPVALD